MPNSPDHESTRTYLVRHVTHYAYELDRTAAYERGRLTPRDTPHQTVRSTELRIEPEPVAHTVHLDQYGNHSDYFEIRGPFSRLDIRRESVVEVARPLPDVRRLNEWTVAETARDGADAPDPREGVEFRLESPLVQITPSVAEFSAGILTPDRPLGEAIEALTLAVYRDFDYKSGATTVRTTLDEVLEHRQGVCQDFAQLAIGAARAAGLPARYVSGYIETSPPPGRPKLQGSDASHAWVSIRTPEGEWVDVDPTNGQFVDSRYIVTAWGRDFQDVSPLRGIVYGESTESTLDVGVDVLPLDAEGNVAVEVVARPAEHPLS